MAPCKSSGVHCAGLKDKVEELALKTGIETKCQIPQTESGIDLHTKPNTAALCMNSFCKLFSEGVVKL